jgi:ABC-type cobalamin transport system permease subunit
MIRAELAVAAIALVAAVAVAGAQAQMQGASETGAFLKPSCRKVSNGASVGVATFGGLFHFNESN